MRRWRFDLYSDHDADVPFHSDYQDADPDGVVTDFARLPLSLAVAIRVALDDERVARIELVRVPS